MAAEPAKRKLPIILASASPRRKQLLEEAGYEFTVVVPDVDESAYLSEQTSSQDYTKILALAKAKSVASRFPAYLVIGSDTIVDFDGEIVGKADDAKDAERVTRMLFSAPHKVITGVAVVCLEDGIEFVESDTTIVYPRKLTERQIAEHIKSGQWEGKAGAYGIQERGDDFVERIEGSLTNVMGFPMELVNRLLSLSSV